MPFTLFRRRQVRAVWMVCLVAGALAAAPALAETRKLPKVSQQYQLTAELSPDQHEVHGRVDIRFINTTQSPLTELVLHLYQNAFQDEESVFMRDSGGRLRRSEATGEGAITLSTLRVDDQDVLASANQQVLKDDATQLRVPLTKPLASGASMKVSAEFVTRLPPAFARSGYDQEFHAVTQWFPKLARLDPAQGFVSFPYHALGEFYADFADYTLEVRAPSNFVVGATGSPTGKREDQGQTSWRFTAQAVHDCAWFAYPHFVEGPPVESDGVYIRMLHPPGYEPAADIHMQVVKAGLRYYGQRFGAYPYRHLTVIVPPRGAGGAAGMEYPTLFVTAGLWFEFPGLPLGSFVTAHELAHQWFQGLVASNEVRWPFLDEGLTEWATYDLMRRLYGDHWQAPLGIALDAFETARVSAAQDWLPAPGRPVYSFARGTYGRSVYRRTALVLESLRRSHGAPRFDRALGQYARSQRFRHPNPGDLFDVVDRAYGPGFADRWWKPALLEGAVSQVRLQQVRSEELDGGFRTEIRASRRGVQLPTWVALFDSRGATMARVPWPADEAELAVSVQTRVKPARVEVDPDRALLLDDSARDQLYLLNAKGSSSRLTARWMGWLQALLSWVGA